MTLTEREKRIDLLHKRIQEENDRKKFIELVRELNDILEGKTDFSEDSGD